MARTCIKVFLPLCVVWELIAVLTVILYLGRATYQLPRYASRRFDSDFPRERSAPNIIFMMADDLGYGDVHYSGGNADTPNLDAMADAPHSVELRRYYSGGPTCSPTRGTVLTGRNHNRYCIYRANRQFGCSDLTCSLAMPLPTSEITVAEILRERGYKTAAFGKWHLGDINPCPLNTSHPQWPVVHPGMHGFDTWWVTPDTVPTATPNCGCYEPPNCTMNNMWRERWVSGCRNYHSIDEETGHLKSYPRRIIGDDSLFLFELLKEFLEEEVDKEEPFFVYFNFHAVHTPVVAIGEYLQRYIERGHSEEQAHYYGTLTAMDEAVGKVRALLKNLSLSDSTMLWFTSDNGPACNGVGTAGKFKGCKGSLHEGGIRVPGIIEWPEMIKSNLKLDIPVVSSDFLPTVCDILGVDPPSDRMIDGTSIMPFLTGEALSRNSSIGFKFCSQQSVVSEHYKTLSSKEGVSLYNLLEDPYETQDVSNENPKLFETMKKEMEDFSASLEHSSKVEVNCFKFSSRDSGIERDTCKNCLKAPPKCSLT